MARKSLSGGLTVFEKSISKKLLEIGWRNQDIIHLLNIGRASTINQGRVQRVCLTTKPFHPPLKKNWSVS